VQSKNAPDTQRLDHGTCAQVGTAAAAAAAVATTRDDDVGKAARSVGKGVADAASAAAEFNRCVRRPALRDPSRAGSTT